jgi:hypothetical protein
LPAADLRVLVSRGIDQACPTILNGPDKQERHFTP